VLLGRDELGDAALGETLTHAGYTFRTEEF
jgi:hypothetical protein